MDLYENLIKRKSKLSIVGLGYVGIPLAVEFSKYFDIIGFDIDREKIKNYKLGIDTTKEVGGDLSKAYNIYFTYDEIYLKEAQFHIISVPTPINSDKTPNLQPLIKATESVARNLTKGSIVVYESTVYPGTTEEICIPILENISNLRYMKDFKVGYSPERINPGDKVNTLTEIVKIISACDEESLEVVENVYKKIIKAGVFRVSSLKVAESAKIVENCQRDVNIAFINEICMILKNMEIDTQEVLKASNTKWNFLDFKPGLVGGHCIGIDPYYLIYKSQEYGYLAELMLAARKVNEHMAIYIANCILKELILSGKVVKGSKVCIMGFTFKENCSDIRNTKVIDIINELNNYGIYTQVYDPVVDKTIIKNEFNINTISFNEITNLDAIIFAVGHDEFKMLDSKLIMSMLKDKNSIIMDIKGIYTKDDFREYRYIKP